ncbi:MAG TPA: endonuclease [Prevotella sp.]|nr:YraN family protein [uncultured Prevotella sp.]HBF06396.1 endonuclease [Candidatus Segatella violae]
MAEHNELGKWGEDEASCYLEDEGYTIIDRDWKIGRRDLDIIAMSPDGDTLVIVEVKTRAEEEYQKPEEAVDKRKMRNLAIAANAYAKEYKIDKNMRFDIISIVGKGHQVESLEHFKDAFNPMLIL